MSLENIYPCQMCRKPFQRYGGSKICQRCLEQIEIDFRKIKDYIYDNPGNYTVAKLVKETEVPEKVILHLMREKRLEIADPTGGALLCSVCKKPISSGTICEKCKESLAKSLDRAVPKPPKSAESEEQNPASTKHYGKMHTYKKDE